MRFPPQKGSLLTFWAKQTSSANKKDPKTVPIETVPVEMPPNSVPQSDGNELVTNDHAQADAAVPCTSNSATSRIATAQLHLQSQIDIMNADLVGLYEGQKRGMLTQEQEVKFKEKKKKKLNWKSS